MTDINYDAMLDGMIEDDGFRLLWALRSKFQWAGCTPTTMGDVEEALERELTDEERERVASSWEWRKGILEVQSEDGNEMIWNMLRDLDIKAADELEEEGA
jgi:hypothetical protein